MHMSDSFMLAALLPFVTNSLLHAPGCESCYPLLLDFYQPSTVFPPVIFRFFLASSDSLSWAWLCLPLWQHVLLTLDFSRQVSFTKGGGEPQYGPYLDMPDNGASGDVRILCRMSQPRMHNKRSFCVVLSCSGASLSHA